MTEHAWNYLFNKEGSMNDILKDLRQKTPVSDWVSDKDCVQMLEGWGVWPHTVINFQTGDYNFLVYNNDYNSTKINFI